MAFEYLRQAWRSLEKNKTYAFLNILGLSAGLACFAFIATWVNDELSYDRFNKNYSRIYRVVGTAKTETGVSASAVSSAPMAPALMNDYPEVENAVRLDMREEIVLHNGEQSLQPGIVLTDPSFFDIFSYHLTKGNAATALKEPYSIILTESAAKKYFGEQDPIGESLTIFMYDRNALGVPYKVTGLMADPPKNAHFTFTMLASFKTVETANPGVLTADGWGDGSFYTYLLLKQGVDHRDFSKKMSQFYGKYIGDMFEVWRSIYFYSLQPLSDIYLHSRLQYEIAPTGNINHVYIFSTIGIFILLLAGINYMNLAIARSMKRAKEAGIKKVVGASRKQLISQYLLEAIVTSLIALFIALAFCTLLQPMFTSITGKVLSPLNSPLLVAFLAGVAVLLGLLSGTYPALMLSAFRASLVLKGALNTGSKGILLRRSLVTAQFIITLVLVTGIIIIHSQMEYVQHKDLGYNNKALLFLSVNGNSDVMSGYTAFKNDLGSASFIKGVARSNSVIANGLSTGGAETVDASGKPLQVNTARLRVDTDYLNVYGMKLLAGRNFSAASTGDSIRQIVLNESAVKNFGWQQPATAIGKPFRMGTQQGIVVGVVKDFHFNSLQEAIQPLAIYPVDARFSRITVQADISKAGQVIAWMTDTWKKHFPTALLDYNFMDRQIEEQYQSEQRFSKIFLYFSVLSLLIACLGLYGLISYSASQRVKEIGIRKVLGANVQGLMLMLTKDYLKLVLLAFVVAIPIAWYVMHNWLQDFAYRISIAWWMFGLSGLAVMLVALLTVSVRAVRAASANPVKSLRTE